MMLSRAFCLLAAIAVASPALADEVGHYTLTLKDHHFTPDELKVPAGQPFVITVINNDGTSEEFDSGALKAEKVIAAHAQGDVHIRALKPGRYPFKGEYNAKDARGVVIAE